MFAPAKPESSVSLHRSPSAVQVSRASKIAPEVLSGHQNCSQCFFNFINIFYLPV